MVKFGVFKFEELNVEDHWIAFPSFGEILDVNVDIVQGYNAADLPIHLSPDEVYQVAMDQSTSNTGIVIKNYRNTEFYMLEVKKATGLDAGEYIYRLELLLHGLFEGCVMSHVIYEKPIKGQSYQSSRVLFQLEGMIQGLPYRYPEFRTVKLDSIVNSSWRSVVIQPGTDSYSRKQQSRVSVEKIWPWLTSYGSSLAEDQDVFEALGIMMGWFFVSFDALGRPYVRGPESTRSIGVMVLPNVTGEQAVKLLADQGVEAMLEIENPKYSIMENLTTMIEHYKVLCVEFNRPYTMLSICIESNLKWENYEHLTCILSNAAYIDATLKEMIGGEFQFVI